MSLAVGRKRAGPLAEINVTPMADVIIVLLIIFMIAVPLLTADPTVRLPRAVNAGKQKPEDLVISLRRDGIVRLGNSELTREQLLERIRPVLLDLPESGRIVYVRADEGLLYAQVERVLDTAREAGAAEVALLTVPRPR
jgi:biopolymer transport protein TolR